jgi:hypothetical protein
VLRPGGELRFFEHVRASGGFALRVQRLLDATVWPIMWGGCHTSRDTVAAIERAGFTVRQLDRFRFPPNGFAGPTAPHVIGIAIKPATEPAIEPAEPGAGPTV